MSDFRREVFLAFLVVPLAFSLMVNVGCGPSAEKRERLKAGDAFVEAKKAAEAGNRDEAIAILSASLEEYPSAWSYFERAKLNLDAGDEEAALADCNSALEVQPNHQDAIWLRDELGKPAAQRFKGKNAEAPSANK